MRGRVSVLWLPLLTVLALAAAASRPAAVRAAVPGSSILDDEETRRMFRQSVALGIPEAELKDLVDRCLATGFSSAELRRVLNLMARAKLAGLPHDDLLNKLREGLAKGAPPETIERAVESKAQALRRAKSLVDALLAEGRTAPNYGYALKVVADCLDAGELPADVLRSVRDGSPPREGSPDVRTAFRDLK